MHAILFFDHGSTATVTFEIFTRTWFKEHVQRSFNHSGIATSCGTIRPYWNK